MKTRKINISLGDGEELLLRSRLLEDEDEEGVDIDRLVRIDMNNIHAEIVTFPLILNDFALMLADMNYKANLAKMKLETIEAELSSKYREEGKDEKTGKALSNEKTAEAVHQDKKYLMYSQLYFKALRDAEYLNAIYWSLKSKDEKLNKLSLTVQAGDVQEALVNSRLRRFNYVDMRLNDK